MGKSYTLSSNPSSGFRFMGSGVWGLGSKLDELFKSCLYIIRHIPKERNRFTSDWPLSEHPFKQLSKSIQVSLPNSTRYHVWW